MEPLAHLNWRYAVKRYQPNTPLSESEVELILESIRLTPTSLGMQTFKVWVIGPNTPNREALLPILNNQPQAVESSHLFVFAAQMNINSTDVQAHAKRMADTRNQDLSTLDKFVQGVSGFLQKQSDSERLMWSHKQTYIALGLAMAEAARAGIDTTPMEGFNKEALNQHLNLTEQGYDAAVILAAGKRDEENDFLANLSKVRKSQNEMFVFV